MKRYCANGKRQVMIKLLCAPLLLVCALAVQAQQVMTICVDNKDWYPFSYLENNKPKGIFVAQVEAALLSQDIKIEFKVMPIKRCVYVLGKAGTIDGIIAVPFSQDLNQRLNYPLDAHLATNSRWRLLQIDFNLVTLQQDDYEFTGKLANIPQPIRIPINYKSIQERFNQAQISIDVSKEDESSFYKLIRDQTGSLITTSIMADKFDENNRYSEKFVVHPYPISSQSYFLAFFPNSKLSPQMQQIIWQELAKLREDYVFMLQLLAEY